MNTIDPRLRQRRIAVRRQEGRRRLRIVMVLGGLVTLIVIAAVLSRTPLFDLDRIDVVGVSGARELAAIEASGLVIGEPLTDLDIGGAEAAINDLPWVEAAAVRRNWPGAVTVSVAARTPIAVLPVGDGSGVLVDREGVALAPTATTVDLSVPIVAVLAEGELGSVQRLALPALTVITMVPEDLEPWIESYDMIYTGESEGEVVIELVGSATAELGVAVDIEAKLETLRTVIGRVDRSCISVIDLRVAELPGVMRDEVCEDEADS